MGNVDALRKDPSTAEKNGGAFQFPILMQALRTECQAYSNQAQEPPYHHAAN